jgi:hypothetical protein
MMTMMTTMMMMMVGWWGWWGWAAAAVQARLVIGSRWLQFASERQRL